MWLPVLEAIAVILAIAYLLLAARESLWCWYCALVSSVIYTVIFWDVSLLMDSLLSVFYVVMAVVGWWQWRNPGGEAGAALQISCLRLSQHLTILAGVVVVSLLNGWYMANYTSAAWPYIDAFTTWGSVVTTWLVVRKVLENWLYWLVIDAVAMALYIERGLYATAALFAAYIVIVIFGYLNWRRLWRQQLET